MVILGGISYWLYKIHFILIQASVKAFGGFAHLPRAFNRVNLLKIKD